MRQIKRRNSLIPLERLKEILYCVLAQFFTYERVESSSRDTKPFLTLEGRLPTLPVSSYLSRFLLDLGYADLFVDGNHPRFKMAPTRTETVNQPTLPHPSFIQVAKPYVFEHAIQKCIQDTGVSQTREDNVRLSGVLWIDSVRKALRLSVGDPFLGINSCTDFWASPVRTFDTAVVYYHKYRLIHPDTECNYVVSSKRANLDAFCLKCLGCSSGCALHSLQN